MVKGIARTAILRLALEQGHSVVSSDLVTEAMERFMPKRSAGATEKLAEALALEKARREPVSLCRQCGLAAKTSDPEVCTVCGARDFEVVTPEMVAAIAELEGGVEEETTYDGRKLAWTQEAKKALRAIDDRYQRRRAKARIEKAAHGRRMDPVTLEFAQRFIEEETGVLYKPHAAAPGGAAAGNGAVASGPVANGNGANGHAAAGPQRDPDGRADSDDDRGLAIVARDDKGNPLLSRREWTADAVARILRVPAGFMRDRTQARVEELAAECGAGTVDLELVEAGIAIGVQAMAEMIAEQEAGQQAPAAGAGETGGDSGFAAVASSGGSAAYRVATASDGQGTTAVSCPFSSATTVQQAKAAAAGGCPSGRAADHTPAGETAEEESRPGLALNEVGLMSELVRKRRELDGPRGE
jgi:hypothetical protein